MSVEGEAPSDGAFFTHMIQSLFGTKQAMTHLYDADGRWVPVTRVNLGPFTATQVKTDETDGYRAVQLASGRTKHLSRPLAGHLKSAHLTAMPRMIQEVRADAEVLPHVGNTITVSDVFHVGDIVNVTGYTKGRGFTGVVKRWGFAGGPKTHGQSDRHRAPGSIGQGTTPGRIHKGKKMAGRHGNERKTIANLRVVKIVPEQHQLWVSGAVPGHVNGRVAVSLVKREASST